MRSRLAQLDALALTAVIWFLAKFLRYAFPPLFGTLRDGYGVSNAVVGSAFTALMLAYAAMQFPSGALADRVGGVRVVTAGAVLAALGALVLSLHLPFVGLVAAMVLVGVGTGAHKTVSVGLLSRIYRDRTGRALGVMDTLGAFGGVVAPAAVVAALAAGSPGWHAVFLAGGLTGLVLAVLFAWRVPRRVPDPTETGEGERGLSAYQTLFADRWFLGFVAVTVLFSFTYNGAVAFLPLYLEEAAGLSPELAGTLYSGLFLVSLVQVVTGDVSDRVGRLVVVGATLGLATTGLAAVVAVPDAGPLVLGVAVVAFGLGSHGFRPVRGAYLVELIPDSVAGGALGVVRTAIMGVGAVAPAAVGIVSDVAGFRAAFALLLVALAGALGLVSVLAVLARGDSTPRR
ncbi:MFS transporter [Haloarchaeobius sp. TZWWS8]|uniref:MFS transporter n=1 Tax=Haloarchaeobius sp. TZWWS8 TaxID=3446121 RepID=UPI003EBAD903